MIETYRKRGRNARLEQHNGSVAIVRTSEHGEASIADGIFRSRTLEVSAPEAMETSPLDAVSQTILEMVENPMLLERMTILDGVADHWWTDGETERAWRERSARAHVTVCNTRRLVRCNVSLGASSIEQIGLEPLVTVIAAMNALGDFSLPTLPVTLAFEPQVTAELWPAMLSVMERQPEQPAFAAAAFEIRQGESAEIPLDGTGSAIRPATLFDVTIRTRFPNVFRPSYRIRPVRAPFHLEGINIRQAPLAPQLTAVAVLAPFEITDSFLGVALLCREGEHGPAFVCRIAMNMDEWLSRVTRAGERVQWFPTGAGSYGCTLVLEDVRLHNVSPAAGISAKG